MSEELEREIERAPDQVALYRVLGDALGGVRGELIAIQADLLGARGREFARLKSIEHAFLGAHGEELCGAPLMPGDDQPDTTEWFCGFFRGIARSAGIPMPPASGSARFLRVVDRWLAAPHPTIREVNSRVDLGVSVHDVSWLWSCPQLDYAWLDQPTHLGDVRHPTLRTLVVDDAPLDALRAAELPALDRLGLVGLRPDQVALAAEIHQRLAPRELHLGLHGAGTIPEPLRVAADILGLWWIDADMRGIEFPRARELHVRGGMRPSFDPLPAMPAVRRIAIFMPDEDDELNASFARSPLARQVEELHVPVEEARSFRALFEHRLEALERLYLLTSSSDPPDRLDLRGALARDVFPKLRSLTITSGGFIARLARLPLAKQLDHLGVAMDWDGDVRELLDNRRAFPRLRSLEIRGRRHFSPELLAELYDTDLDIRWRGVTAVDPWWVRS